MSFMQVSMLLVGNDTVTAIDSNSQSTLNVDIKVIIRASYTDTNGGGIGCVLKTSPIGMTGQCDFLFFWVKIEKLTEL